MDSERKKALKDAYKMRPVIGGVCCIRCSGNGRRWIQATRDTESLRNRFNFSMATKSCPDPSMRREWEEYGTESFSFTVLEELEKGKDQTDQEYADDLNALHEMWLEKSGQGIL